MIRVLHSVSYMHRAGVETLLMNYYRHIDRSQLQFDFLCNKHKVGEYDAEIQDMGGRIFYSSGCDSVNLDEYLSQMMDFFSNHPEIKIVHTHNGAKQIYPLLAARHAGVMCRISHAHGTDFIHDDRYDRKIQMISQLPSLITACFACSNKAGRFFYGDDYWTRNGVLLCNAIETEHFAWNDNKSKKLRRQLGLDGCYVIGHVGRFQEQKNHKRLVDIFSSVYSQWPNARLLLVGSGPLLEDVREHAIELNCADAIIFAGEQVDPAPWYQAMDVYVMPSLFEGLPVSGVEAQAAGLPCVFSDAVTVEAMLTPSCAFLPLECDNNVWAAQIMAMSSIERDDTHNHLATLGYDINNAAAGLQVFYVNMLQEKGSAKGD